jgi:hypothetical protein
MKREGKRRSTARQLVGKPIQLPDWIDHVPVVRVDEVRLAVRMPGQVELHDAPVRHRTGRWARQRSKDSQNSRRSSVRTGSPLEWDAKIPPFPVVHAEVLKARDHMSGALSVAASGEREATSLPAASAGVSNPVSFLVPEVNGADSGVVRSY